MIIPGNEIDEVDPGNKPRRPSQEGPARNDSIVANGSKLDLSKSRSLPVDTWIPIRHCASELQNFARPSTSGIPCLLPDTPFSHQRRVRP